jgi:RNA polymerase primary sigma factor
MPVIWLAGAGIHRDRKARRNVENSVNRSECVDLSGLPIDDPIGLYFTEMSSVPLLTYEEEVELATRLERAREAQRLLSRNGHDSGEKARLERLVEQGQEARQHLIEANTRLVVSVAKRYREQGAPFLDLIQAGNLGLIRAADKFDYRKGFKFGTYATWWIRQAVTRTLSQQERTIRLPVHMGDRVRRVYRTAQRLEQDLGCRPTPEEIGAEMSSEPERIRWMLRVSQRPLSLDKPLDEEWERELGDSVEDESSPSPAQSAERQLLREDIERILTTLTWREARVVSMRFGLRGSRGYTLEEVGRKLGVTRERARQIECKALRKLRHPRRARGLRGYLR